MIPVMCLVQEGGIDPSVGAALQADLSNLVRQVFGDKGELAWIEVKKGNGFTQAMPSTSSLVSIQANRPLAHDERVSIMKSICDFWMKRTGCSINEIVAAVNDPAGQAGR